ncbi:DUF6896 domain-containing protein [Epilithonimonas caeni]|uniref:DUF6896 domain-containing protein n=1 Tax=Epilithonimonas caeni TaxID=365343 RepID=UPI0004216B32|nr:hypothetical protein [Epilithonimonas caeni]
MQELELLIIVIKAFENKANEMIKILADEFNLDLSAENPFGKLLNVENNLRKGKLRENWTYWFHGDASDFINIETEQFLHVKINRAGNFGAIDNHYLFEFLQTTKSLDYIRKNIETEKKFGELLSILTDKGILVNIGEDPFKTLILKH